jgi:hypothetical protein
MVLAASSVMDLERPQKKKKKKSKRQRGRTVKEDALTVASFGLEPLLNHPQSWGWNRLQEKRAGDEIFTGACSMDG